MVGGVPELRPCACGRQSMPLILGQPHVLFGLEEFGGGALLLHLTDNFGEDLRGIEAGPAFETAQEDFHHAVLPDRDFVFARGHGQFSQ